MIHDLLIYTPMYVTLFWCVVFLTIGNKKNRAKHFLGFFMLAAFIVYLSHAVFLKKHDESFLSLDPLYHFASLSVYPLYYWYLKLITIDTKLKLNNLRMLIPAITIGILMTVVYIFMSPDERTAYLYGYIYRNSSYDLNTVLIKVQKALYLLSRSVFVVQVIVFLIWGIRLIKKHNARIENFYSNLEDKRLIWEKIILISFIATSFMSIAVLLIGIEFFHDVKGYLYGPSLIFSILLFVIGMQGNMQNNKVTEMIEEENKPKEEIEIFKQNNTVLKERLLQLFEDDKIYKDPDLKIMTITRLLNTNRTYISNMINSDFYCSFSTFVNRYRVEEAKRYLLDNKHHIHTLRHIAHRSGFGSQSSFTRVFKELTGLSPGQFKMQYSPDRDNNYQQKL